MERCTDSFLDEGEGGWRRWRHDYDLGSPGCRISDRPGGTKAERGHMRRVFWQRRTATGCSSTQNPTCHAAVAVKSSAFQQPARHASCTAADGGGPGNGEHPWPSCRTPALTAASLTLAEPWSLAVAAQLRRAWRGVHAAGLRREEGGESEARTCLTVASCCGAYRFYRNAAEDSLGRTHGMYVASHCQVVLYVPSSYAGMGPTTHTHTLLRAALPYLANNTYAIHMASMIYSFPL